MTTGRDEPRAASAIEAFAPGRLCLFGEHQDYLGLAVIALAIDRGVHVRLEPDASGALNDHFAIELADLGVRDRIAIDGSTEPELDPAAGGGNASARWLRAAVQELVRQGVRFPGGARVVVESDLPSNAGCGSSSALVVAFLRALLLHAGASAERWSEPRRLAEIAWQAEVGRFGAPGGRMDQLASALGGLHHLNFGPTPFVQALDVPLGGLVLIESGEPKATVALLARTRAAVERAIAPLRALDPTLDLAALSFDAAWNLLVDATTRNGGHAGDHVGNHAGDRDGGITGGSAGDSAAAGDAASERERLLFATLRSRDLLLAALRCFTEAPLDRARIGELLDQHHGELRDGLRVSTDRIETLRRAALDAGALGAKLTGSGGGGCLFAYAPEREQEVVAAVTARGARATLVRPSKGASARRVG